MEWISLRETTGALAAAINAMAVYELRLQSPRTWPCDTAMLRTLLFSLFIPAAVELAKLTSQHLFWLLASHSLRATSTPGRCSFRPLEVY
jgi:hypothetical protein